ncbi:TonB-dependent siderophore receptor [Acinetobacter larvae]|uniref:Secretin/TonB short N-terminal domain-containing protein n=1 Tax=Acinetobacter larvae TaxID=1789224 RepID=A0A1B2LZJ5_9GAMM|nr:TonB-dependent receptor [Acinetobacter larvae]AOA58366.1 hypothetical protein BFG52_08370 [Acinetobacter larvae]
MLQIKPLALALHLMILGSGGLYLNTAYASPALKTYHVDAGSLSNVLTKFAQQSGTAIIVDANKIKGIQSVGVQGQYSVEQGFAELLKGTNYHVVKTTQGYILRADSLSETQATGALAAGGQDIVELEKISLYARNSKQNSDVAELPIIQLQADDQSYVAKQVSIGKINQSLKEIPQSVSVIKKQQIEDQGFNTMADTLNQATGVIAYGYSGSENYQVRFADANVQVNGVPQANNISNEDPALYEQIEILRGPSGLLTGSGNPSGSINFVRKRPVADTSASFALSAGSWGSYRSEFDVSDQLDQEGRLRARLIGIRDHKGKFRNDEKDDDKTTLYAAVDYDLTERATFGLATTYIQQEYINFWGLPQFLDGRVPDRKDFAGYNKLSKLEQKQIAADFSYHFDNQWIAKAAYNYNRINHNNYGTYASEGMDVNGRTTANVGYIEQEYTNTSFDINLSGPVQLWGREHQLLLGYNQWKSDSLSGARYVKIPDWDILHHHDYSAYIDSNILNSGNSLTQQSGIYASAKLKVLDPLTVIIGGRWSDYRMKERTVGQNATPWQKSDAQAKGEFTPYLGIVWDINPQFTWYASYADSFVPQSQQNFEAKTLDPRIGWQIETGVKADFLDGALTTNAAIFQIRDKNRSMLDPDHVGCAGSATGECYRAAGEVQSRGIELEIVGKPTDQFNLSASYTYNDIKTLSDSDPENVGRRFGADAIPKQMFKLWTLYKFDERYLNGALHGFDAGFGVQAQSNTYNTTTTRPGFSTFSMRIGYEINPYWQASLQVNNLLDKSYLTYPGNANFYNIYAAPRNVMLTLRAKY